MAVTVPSTDPVHYNMQQSIATLATQITNSTSAGASPVLIQKLTRDKANLQFALAVSLLGAGKILASNVLANESYSATGFSDGQ